MEKNIRKMQVTPDSGDDFRNTKVLDGMTKKSGVHNATNETMQYTTGTTAKGPLGGENSNS